MHSPAIVANVRGSGCGSTAAGASHTLYPRAKPKQNVTVAASSSVLARIPPSSSYNLKLKRILADAFLAWPLQTSSTSEDSVSEFWGCSSFICIRNVVAALNVKTTGLAAACSPLGSDHDYSPSLPLALAASGSPSRPGLISQERPRERIIVEGVGFLAGSGAGQSLIEGAVGGSGARGAGADTLVCQSLVAGADSCRPLRHRAPPADPLHSCANPRRSLQRHERICPRNVSR